jgi:hypothetical protein
VLVIAVVVVVVFVFVMMVLLTLNGKEVKVRFKLMPVYDPILLYNPDLTTFPIYSSDPNQHSYHHQFASQIK